MRLLLAYIDPGTGGVFLQLLIAALVGSAFFCRRALARFFGLFARRKKSGSREPHAESAAE